MPCACDAMLLEKTFEMLGGLIRICSRGSVLRPRLQGVVRMGTWKKMLDRRRLNILFFDEYTSISFLKDVTFVGLSSHSLNRRIYRFFGQNYIGNLWKSLSDGNVSSGPAVGLFQTVADFCQAPTKRY